MRLLIVSSSPLEKVGSDYYAVDTWIRIPGQLSEHFDRVTLWSPVRVLRDGGRPQTGSWRVDLGKVIIEPQDYYHSFAGYFRRWPLRYVSLRRQASELMETHDLVLLRFPSPMAVMVSRRAVARNRPMILMVLGNIQTQANIVNSGPRLKRLIGRVLVKLFVLQEVWCGRRAQRVYAYSKEIAYRHGGCSDRVRTMQDPLLQMADIVDRNGFSSKEEYRIVRVCWLIPGKGIEYLIDAVSILVKKGIRVRLEIVGKERFPGYQASLERRAEGLGIRDRVTFSGWMPFDRIREVYLRNDIQVISSLAEGTPRCIGEGFARGLPLVCTAVGGCRDVLVDERDALLVPPADPAAIADAVERLVADGELRRRLIRQGYETARSVTFETLGMQFVRELKEVVGRGAGA